MKKLLFIVLPMLAIISCSKMLPQLETETNREWGEIKVGVSPEILTKSSSAAAETAVKGLQVFVFDKNGNIVSYASSKTDNLTMNVPLNIPGYVVYALANCPDDLSKVSSVEELNSSTAKLSNDSREQLQMFGHTEGGISFAKGTAVNVPVKRFAAKIEIDSIRTSFTNYNHQISNFKLKGIYVINVNGTCPFSMVPASGNVWYNKLSYVSGDCENLLSDHLTTPFFLQTEDKVSHPYSTPHYFYVYPNPVTDDKRGGNWAPRRTRLVVETSLGTQTYYYPIDIFGEGEDQKILSNCLYKISQLTITGLGTFSPDDILEKGSINFKLTILDWASGCTKEITY